jgi:hypothetical protein
MTRSWIHTNQGFDATAMLDLRAYSGLCTCAFMQLGSMNDLPKPDGNGRLEQLV